LISLSDLKTGVIGLGAMGGPIARHLASEGLLASVWNRTTKKAEVLSTELGVTRKDSPLELAADCNVLLTCVSADEDLEAVLKLASPGLTPGDVVIDTSTVSPVLTRRLAEQLAQNSVGFVDAPVSGGVEGAVKGTLSVMAGGDFATFSRVCQFLKLFRPQSLIWGRWGRDRRPRL